MDQPLDNFLYKCAAAMLFLNPSEQEIYLDAVKATIDTADYKDYLSKSAEDLLMEAATAAQIYLQNKRSKK